MVWAASAREQLGTTVRRARVRRSPTQRDLARLLGLSSHAHVAAIESGRVSVGSDTLCRIADALDVKVSDLLSLLD